MRSVFQPGDLVRRYANLHGWTLCSRSVIVEGEHDVRYFRLADGLYFNKTGLRLLNQKFSIFATGLGKDGGAFGIQRHFHPLRANMDCDLTPEGKRVFHAIALFDGDIEGRRGFNALTGQHLNYRKWRDIFVLHRVMPRTTRDPEQLAKFIEIENRQWAHMNCEIEDMLSTHIVKGFLGESAINASFAFEEQGDGFHCNLTTDGKTHLVRFAEVNAILEDVYRLVETLKFLRFHLGLTPDGDRCDNMEPMV